MHIACSAVAHAHAEKTPVPNTISTQSSSAHVEERDQELWGTLEQDLSLIGFSKKQ